MLGRITQSLPDSSRLNEYRVESDGHVLLDGTVLDESIVYELVNSLRRLPGVTQVALERNDSGRIRSRHTVCHSLDDLASRGSSRNWSTR